MEDAVVAPPAVTKSKLFSIDGEVLGAQTQSPHSRTAWIHEAQNSPQVRSNDPTAFQTVPQWQGLTNRVSPEDGRYLVSFSTTNSGTVPTRQTGIQSNDGSDLNSANEPPRLNRGTDVENIPRSPQQNALESVNRLNHSTADKEAASRPTEKAPDSLELVGANDDAEKSNLDLKDSDLDQFDEDDFEGETDQEPFPQRPAFGVWPRRSIEQVRIDESEYGQTVPEDRSANLHVASKRNSINVPATQKVFAWASPNIRYQPLYFEDATLERYGQTRGLVKQPFVSARKFLADGLFLPIRAHRVPPKSCDSPLGFQRPGSPAHGTQCGCSSRTP